ncbi:hypothetical protein BN14_11497 [Rhizoctonia solani AG-1 IB]|uniref:CCHC-type domain-containing protein n=1 Tax=Thanatephorus cucumeris (strain AG1-IB / isolate 7/3/14) TaxID=1108050 RepID=M5CH68_THACB|nr:hypothetical protein BN14_11497 [Rhizoctonia solani AG-1 IB]
MAAEHLSRLHALLQQALMDANAPVGLAPVTPLPPAAADPPRIDGSCPKFDGTIAAHHVWASRARSFFEDQWSAITSAARVRSLFSQALEGDAAELAADTLPQVPLPVGATNDLAHRQATLAALLNWARDNFADHAAGQKAILEFGRLRQPNEQHSFGPFLAKFEQLRTRGGLLNGTEEAAVDLRRKIRAELAARESIEAIDVSQAGQYGALVSACRFWDARTPGKAPKVERIAAPFVEKIPPAKLLGNNVKWEWHADVPANLRGRMDSQVRGDGRTTREVLVAEARCFHCRRQGHAAGQCPDKTQVLVARPPQVPAQPPAHAAPSFTQDDLNNAVAVAVAQAMASLRVASNDEQ